MQTLQAADCDLATAVKLERVNFFNRQLLTADDMTTERDYFLQKLRRHNRFLHGWGVVCGLTVVAAPTSSAPWRVQIDAGYALGPFGDEIFVGEPIYFDLAACLSTSSGGNPCEPSLPANNAGTDPTTVYLAIEYAECLSRPVQVAYSGCGCDDDPCQYSRIRDGFRLQCLAQPPATPVAPPNLCDVVAGKAVAACPACPTEPWVTLAKIALPAAASAEVTAQDIDNISARRVILSVAVLQDQVISCCCEPQTPPAPTVDLATFTLDFTSSDVNPATWTNSASTIGVSSTPWRYRLTLTGPAPQGGFVVKFNSSAPNITEPASVTVPAGETVYLCPASAPVDAHPTQSVSTVTVSITAIGTSVSKQGTLVFQPSITA